MDHTRAVGDHTAAAITASVGGITFMIMDDTISTGTTLVFIMPIILRAAARMARRPSHSGGKHR